MTMELRHIALVAATLAILCGCVLALTGCSPSGSGSNRALSNFDWNGTIYCKDGVCTPTLTVGYSPPAAPAPTPRLGQLAK